MLTLHFQDVVVSVFALLALLVLLRPFVPALRGRAARGDALPPCASCAAGAAAKTRTSPRR